MTTLNWNETYDNLDDDALAARNTAARYLCVGDGSLTHGAVLPDGMSVGMALADYASDYEADPSEVEIEVGWTLYENGVETKNGSYTFVK